ncbi:MAG: ABC transporter permease [Chloroflexi bacterium]|nr:ABC transporter permease [Chloroflexota bacterium]
MGGYILRRVLQAIPTLFLSTVAVFLLLRLLPGDPALVLAGTDAPPEVISAVRQQMGLNEPLPVQYVLWLGHVVQGDFGRSILSKLPVSQLIAQRLPVTLQLAITAFVLSTLLALALGITAAVNQRSWVDWTINSFVGLGIAVPNFWLGILLIILFALVLSWLPPGGHGDFTTDPGQALKLLILPAFTLALPSGLGLSRLVKATMLEVLYEDYVRTARAKGLASTSVLVGHALRNALIPLVTALGFDFGRLLGGAVIIESIFGWPGVGTLMLQGIGNRDYPVVQAGLLLLVVVFIGLNLLIDLSYGVLDPRIRVSRAGARA